MNDRSDRLPTRLTRRGRLVFIGAPTLVIALLIPLVILGPSIGGPAAWLHEAIETAVNPQCPPAMGLVEVQPGQTVWGIAKKQADARKQDARPIADSIVCLNRGISVGHLDAGTYLKVPFVVASPPAPEPSEPSANSPPKGTYGD